MHTRAPYRACVSGLAAAVALLVLNGCSAPPTTSYVNDQGVEVTVSWAEYPGAADMEAAQILSAPSQQEVEVRVNEIFAQVQAALTEAYGLDWSEEGQSAWYPHLENGYGGDSMLITYNSAGRVSDSVPVGPDAWQNIIERVSGIVTGFGFDDLVLDHEGSPYSDEEAWQKELQDRFGTGNPDEYWQWNATAQGNSQWLSVSITDVTKDPTGDAAEDYPNGSGRSVSLSFGATTVPAGARDDFERALEPFDDLDKPEATHS